MSCDRAALHDNEIEKRAVLKGGALFSLSWRQGFIGDETMITAVAVTDAG